MPRDSDATKNRVLQAAYEEFAANGLAGGRVDRIAAAAQANKRAIYDYFGSKEELFDTVVGAAAAHLTEQVPLDSADLPGYAGALFDFVVGHPEVARLIRWRQLERPESPTPTSPEFFDQMRRVDDTATGATRRIDRVDLVIFILALANAWLLTGAELAVADGGDPTNPERVAAHRAAVVEATRRLTA